MTLKRNQNRATLQAVADRAGVSVTTASLVLSGKHEDRRISESAQDRVLKAAADLNYAPNLLVRSLRKGRSHILAFYNGFLNRERSDLYMDKLSTSIEFAGGAQGYDVLVQCNYRRTPQESYQFLNGGMADGVLLFAPSSNDPLVQLLRQSDLPVVLLNARDHAGVFPSVADDNETGLKMLADTLVDLGHRRIAAFLDVQNRNHDSELRGRNLQRRLEQRGISDLTIFNDVTADNVEQQLQALWNSDQRPTALFCWHDRLAYQALDACDRLGILVPNELSIIGYDGIRWPSRSPHVAASIQINLQTLAEQAVDTLNLYINGYNGPLLERTLPVSLSPGTTLGPAKDLSQR